MFRPAASSPQLQVPHPSAHRPVPPVVRKPSKDSLPSLPADLLAAQRLLRQEINALVGELPPNKAARPMPTARGRQPAAAASNTASTAADTARGGSQSAEAQVSTARPAPVYRPRPAPMLTSRRELGTPASTAPPAARVAPRLVDVSVVRNSRSPMSRQAHGRGHHRASRNRVWKVARAPISGSRSSSRLPMRRLTTAAVTVARFRAAGTRRGWCSRRIASRCARAGFCAAPLSTAIQAAAPAWRARRRRDTSTIRDAATDAPSPGPVTLVERLATLPEVRRPWRSSRPR